MGKLKAFVHKNQNNIEFFLTITMVIIAFYGGVLSSNGNGKVAMPSESTASVGFTGSMYPFLEGGNTLEEISVDEKDELLCGNVYVYQNGEQRTVHRFVYESGDGKLIFKGDNNQYPDKPVNRSNIISRVVGVRFD